MGAPSLVMQIGGLAASTAGSYYGASQQKIGLRSEASIADINARLAEMSAQSALFKGEREVGALTMRAGQMKGSQRAAMAANGIDLGTGSAAEVQASTDVMKEMDANTLIANAVREAWGHRTQATNYRNEALMKRASAKAIKPGLTAASTLLGGAGSVASSWYTLNKEGALDGTVFALKG
ncbi:MAG: hypothetical protein H3C57_00665 [Gammaproteobacteria bacterium]|nr:hypothetical protein [Gammaproteobacteria bacterium]